MPIGFGMASPPTGTSACRRLFAGMSRPRIPNRRAMCSMSSSRRSSATPMSSAMASRVTSSCVGPSPPHTMSASAPRRRSRIAPTIRPGCHRPCGARTCRSRPRRAARRSTRCWCRRSDRAAAPSRPRARLPSSAPRSRLLLPPATHEIDGRRRRPGDRDPQHDVVEPATSAVGGNRTTATARNCTFAFHFPSRARRDRVALASLVDAVCRDEELAGRRRSPPASHAKSPRIASATNPPITRILSARGSRKAPERVVPSRRARMPSSPSVSQSTIQPANVPQLPAPSSRIQTSTGIAKSSRRSGDQVGRGVDRGLAEAPRPLAELLGDLGRALARDLGALRRAHALAARVTRRPRWAPPRGRCPRTRR